MPPEPFVDEVTTDWKPQRRVRDLELLRQLHTLWRGACVLADLGDCDVARYSLHHIHGHPRDDVEPNLAMMCGDGVRGHHGLITRNDRATLTAFGLYVVTHRPDTVEYLTKKLGEQQAAQWLRNRLYARV